MNSIRGNSSEDHGKLKAAWRFMLAGAIAVAAVMVSGEARAESAMPVSQPAAAAPGSISVNIAQKAQPDECFVAIGSTHNLFPATMPCAEGQPKVNQGYVWGLTSAGKNLWYGTSANQLCTVISGIEVAAGITPVPFQTNSYVCEFGQSNFLVTHPTVPPALGDWRPPEIFSYDRVKGVVTNRTPNDALIDSTLGIRAAGTTDNIVILGGPVLAPFGTLPPGINLFAFKKSNGAYLGSTTLTQFSDIRTWTVLNGVTYTGVENSDGSGSILRWTGNTQHPFSFSIVGHIDNDAAYVVAYHGRIFAGTWGGASGLTGRLSGIWMSPSTTGGELTTKNLNQWTEVWRVDDYEPDPVTAQTLLTGALGVLGGRLYWGTMQVPLSGALLHYKIYPRMGSPTPGDLVAALVNTTRPATIFRCCGGASLPKTFVGSDELLYGSALMGVYDPVNSWHPAPNVMNAEPTFGQAGFGNPFNTYTWAMSKFNSALYVGTFDWSYVLGDMLTVVLPILGAPSDEIPQIDAQYIQALNPALINYGADLWEFTGANPAVALSQYGLENFLNYGVRNLVTAGNKLYFGMADPMNLRTSPDLLPNGGFELLSTP